MKAAREIGVGSARQYYPGMSELPRKNSRQWRDGAIW